MNQEIITKCYNKFELRERRGQGNQMFKYINSKDIIHRMNTIFAGNWSSEVLQTETIDNQVLVRVRVCITDPETGKMYYHEGFGSSQIARYTSGANDGKIIDIGNAYKGALSKGIVNACRMWGVGLFKEADFEFDEDDDNTVPVPPPATPLVPVTAAATIPPQQPVVPAVPTAPVSTAPSIPTRPTLPSAASLPVRNDMPLKPPVAVAVAKSSPPPEKPMESAPPPIVAVPPTDLPFSATETVNKINDVQKVAISGILTLRKMTYDQLATEAFADAGAPGYQYPPVENLTYDEAVVVIKYGNNKFRKH